MTIATPIGPQSSGAGGSMDPPPSPTRPPPSNARPAPPPLADPPAPPVDAPPAPAPAAPPVAELAAPEVADPPAPTDADPVALVLTVCAAPPVDDAVASMPRRVTPPTSPSAPHPSPTLAAMQTAQIRFWSDIVHELRSVVKSIGRRAHVRHMATRVDAIQRFFGRHRALSSSHSQRCASVRSSISISAQPIGDIRRPATEGRGVDASNRPPEVPFGARRV